MALVLSSSSLAQILQMVAVTESPELQERSIPNEQAPFKPLRVLHLLMSQ